VGRYEAKHVHKSVDFKIPSKPYLESGLLLNYLLRTKFAGIAYAGLHVGYFYHWNNTNERSNNGRFVIGFGFDL
jgi:hypothetical protein